MAGRYDPNPGRWVCVYPRAECGEKIMLYGEIVPCPLAAACRDNPKNHYEFPLTRDGPRRRYQELMDPDWRKKHAKKRYELLKTFTPGFDRGWNRAYRAKNKDAINAQRREKRHQAYRERDDGWSYAVPTDFGRGTRHLLLPCGEDCGKNCPHDGVCPYTDEDEDRLYAEEHTRSKIMKKKEEG